MEIELTVIVVASVLGVGLVAVLVSLTRHFLSSPSSPPTAEWVEDLSIDRYRPMLRLLDSSELEFLREQPGFKPSMESRLRIQRSRIFRGYLRNLEDDFKRTCMAIRVMMLQSAEDRPDLASILLRSQMSFACGILIVQFEVLCYRLGMVSVDVGGLVKLFDAMRLELLTLVPAEMAALS